MKNQNLQQVMRRAHQIARTLEGNYSARMSYSLKKAWEELRGEVVNTVNDFMLAMHGLTSFYMNAEKKEALFMLSCMVNNNELTGFAFDVAKTVNKYRNCSQKQLYVIARGMQESNLFFVKNYELYYK